MIRVLKNLAACSAIGFVVTACGTTETEKRASPPPTVASGKSDAFALTPGKFYVSEIHDLVDGCGKNPMGEPAITSIAFILSNDGAANVSLDFCSHNGRSITGQVHGNVGTLSVINEGKQQGEGVFNQDCQMKLTVTSNNVFVGNYTERQWNRNEAMRRATKDVAECTTSFSFTMQTRS